MQGLLFLEIDKGKFGAHGYADHTQIWHLVQDGHALHIKKHFTGKPGEEQLKVTVTECDESCPQLVNIPEHVVTKALPKIQEIIKR
ncbi:MAG: hypothetical protein C3F02_04650 [Parcubacteria group bacterium]|nr:MAG: hypothetical protein C3F02_04650 [Parcubacteria group bacterium]